MRKVLIYLLFALVASYTISDTTQIRSSLSQLLRQKHKRNQIPGSSWENQPILKSHGKGLSDGQEALILTFVNQAFQSFGTALYQNSVYIQQKVEDSLSGKWNVEIFEFDPNWGRSTYINNDQWMMLVGYGAAQLDYIIWAPSC